MDGSKSDGKACILSFSWKHSPDEEIEQSCPAVTYDCVLYPDIVFLLFPFYAKYSCPTILYSKTVSPNNLFTDKTLSQILLPGEHKQRQLVPVVDLENSIRVNV